MDILTQTISYIFRPRLQAIARFASEADRIQREQLRGLIHAARNTEWGHEHGYRDIRSYADFSARVPVQLYDDIKPYVERMINGERNILWPSAV